MQSEQKNTTVYEDIRVDVNKVNSILNTVGELVISYTMLKQTILSAGIIVGSKTEKELSSLDKIIKQMQRQIMAIKMVKIKPAFQKMARMVRELALKEGKQVVFVTEGEETELDKTVIEELNDPILHLIRNSIGHGIESPAEREKTGKSAEGHISISACHKGDNIIITISDDGRGIDKEAILKKAVEKKLTEPLKNLTESEIYNMIFKPGFSTAKEVTSLSGRGVGLDVVKKGVDKLRGKVSVSSKPGEGTTFTVSLPLTMAIIDGMLVNVGGEKFIIPTFSIVESICPRKEDITNITNKGEMVSIRDKLFPIVRLYKLYDITPKSVNPWEAILILAEANGSRICIMVDALIDQQQVVIRNLDSRFNHSDTIAGGAILGDGKISLILDVDKLIGQQIN